MNIDLVYYFREVNNYYYLNGPEKVNGNIVNNSPSYQFSSASDVISKINQMIASLAPDITNVGLVTSELYTGNIQINTYSGELKASSEVPDYTEILSSINTNLSNISSKLKESNDNKSISGCLERIFNCFNATGITLDPATIRTNSLIRAGLFSSGMSQSDGLAKWVDRTVTTLVEIRNLLKQSVSPNASITDVISALNSNIHNDLTNINTTENNKDTVLIIDGQQEFKLRKDDE